MSDLYNNATFLEKEFYHAPPSKSASLEEWSSWLFKEKKSREDHARSQASKPNFSIGNFESMFFGKGVGVEQDGVYRQKDSFVGFDDVVVDEIEFDKKISYTDTKVPYLKIVN